MKIEFAVDKESKILTGLKRKMMKPPLKLCT